MEIKAALVKELRERTGAAMMDCKNALVDCGGDIEAAIELMRKSGAAKAAKKAGRIAADGTVVIEEDEDHRRVLVLEVNSETDFVAKDENFRRFADAVAQTALQGQATTVEELLALPLAGSDPPETVETARAQLVAKLGENVTVRRFEILESDDGVIGSYRHGQKIGVAVEMHGGDPLLAKDIAMHIAASRPVCVSEKDVPEEMVAKEREILTAQAAESGKPEEIVAKMVDGRLKKFFNEVTLLGQNYVKDPEITVASLLKGKGAEVARFIRVELGEGIEKQAENFAQEVMAQVGKA